MQSISTLEEHRKSERKQATDLLAGALADGKDVVREADHQHLLQLLLKHLDALCGSRI